MRRGRKFPSDLRSPSTFCTGITPATYRLDAFRKNYRKGGLIGTYVYLALQKPFRESPSSGTSHSRSRGQLHDRNEKTAATKIPRSAGDAARLCARCHLPSSLDGAECKSDSLVGGNSKRMMLTPLSSSCVGSDSRRVISHSLTTPNFSVRRRMMSSRHRKQPFPWHCQRYGGRSSCFLCENTKRAARSSKPQVLSRKCTPASSLSSASCSLGVTSTPFSHRTAPWRSSSSPTPSSSFPTPQSTLSPPDIWLPVPNHHFQARKKTPPYGRVFLFSGC